jgi:hypothetical protein
VNTGQSGHTQPAVWVFSLAFPLAQKTFPLNLDFTNVGQLGQVHCCSLSLLSGTELPKIITKKTFMSALISIFDCFLSTTAPAPTGRRE